MDRACTESAQTGEQKQRLYPSLPNTNRVEVCLLNRSSPNIADTTHRLQTLGISQAEGCDVSCKEHIQVLEEQKRELLSINKGWSKEYRLMEQYYKDKVGSGDVSDVLVKAQREAKQLQEQNRELTRRGQQQKAEIARLNKALEEAFVTETPQYIWEQQAEVYKEDFLKERKDREVLKGKYLELERKYKKVRNELYAIKSQGTWTTSELQNKCTCTQQDITTHNNENKRTEEYCKRRYTFNDKL